MNQKRRTTNENEFKNRRSCSISTSSINKTQTSQTKVLATSAIDKTKGAIRKTTLTRCEKPISSTNQHLAMVTKHSLTDFENRKYQNPKALSTTTSATGFDVGAKKLHIPQVNSSTSLSAKWSDELRKKKSDKDELRSKALAFEVTKKLNFPLDKEVFKDLTPINVNDSILMPSNHQLKKSFKVKYLHDKSTKDPVPDLKDFITPIKPLKFEMEDCSIRRMPLRKPNNDRYEQVLDIIHKFHPTW